MGIATLATLVLAGGAQAAPIAGDFDGDGRDDLAIGVAGQTLGTAFQAGAVQVVYGSGAGLSARDRIFSRKTKGMKGAVGSDSFGMALAAGDFDRDGFDDLAIGAPVQTVRHPTLGPVQNAGAVQVLYGTRRGLVAKGNQLFVHGKRGLGAHARNGDAFGWTLAAGNFGKGRHDDLAIGTYLGDVPGTQDAGYVEVLHGSRDGLRTKGRKRFSQATPGVAEQPAANDEFGYSLAPGDFGRSRHDDLAIGVRRESVGGAEFAGAAHVLYGSPRSLRTRGAQYLDQLEVHGGIGGADTEPEEGDHFGDSLAAGDFGRGGRDDLAVGAPREDYDNAVPGLASSTGLLSVAYGAKRGLRIGASGNPQLFYESVITQGFGDGTAFGAGLAAANFGRGGHADLAIGAVGMSADFPQVGAAGVVYGSANGLQSDQTQLFRQGSDGVEGSGQSGDLFGWSLAGGQFDGRGPADLAIGVPGESGFVSARGAPSVQNYGAVALLLGTPSGVTTAGDRLLRQGSDGLAGAPEQNDLFGLALSGPGGARGFD